MYMKMTFGAYLALMLKTCYLQ